MIKPDDKLIMQVNAVPPKPDKVQNAVDQAGIQRPTMRSTAGRSNEQRAHDRAEYRQKKTEYKAYQQQQRLEDKAKFGDKKAQATIAQQKQAVADKEKADQQIAVDKAKQAKDAIENSVENKIAKAVDALEKGVWLEMDSLRAKIDNLDDVVASDSDVPDVAPLPLPPPFQADSMFTDQSYAKSIDLYDRRFATLYGFYSYDNQMTIDDDDGVLVRDKNQPHALKYVNADVFGGGTESPHRWEADVNSLGTSAEMVTGGTITCDGRRIEVSAGASIAFPDSSLYNPATLVAITNDEEDDASLYWEEQLVDAGLRASNIIRIASFAYNEPDWSKTEQRMLSDVISNEDRHSMRFLLEGIDLSTGLGTWKMPASQVAVNGDTVTVNELAGIAEGDPIYLRIRTGVTGSVISAQFQTIFETNSTDTKCVCVGVAGGAEYVPSWGSMHRGDAHTTDGIGCGKSVDRIDTDEFVFEVRNFKAGTTTSLRCNQTDVPDNIDYNTMVVRETGINGTARPEVKYATASSVVNWLTYDTTSQFPYQKIGGLYDYIRESTDYTGEFWVTNGDETTCKGSAIGSNLTSLVIDLDYQALQGDWSATGSFYSPYIYAGVVDAYVRASTPDMYCDNIYARSASVITFAKDIYANEDITSSGTILSGSTVEATMGFICNGEAGVTVDTYVKGGIWLDSSFSAFNIQVLDGLGGTKDVTVWGKNV